MEDNEDKMNLIGSAAANSKAMASAANNNTRNL